MTQELSYSPSRRRFVRSATALAATLGLNAAPGAGAQQKPAPERPNVLLILADDLGWSDIGCYGGEIQTPHIDALARDGLRFTQFYNSARCCPSRAALLTGLHPHQAGFPDMQGTLPLSAVTLPEVLKPAGYNTYMVGKWHLSEQNTPVMRGFDEFYGMLGGFNSFWQEDPYYTRLPAGRPKRKYAPGDFYSTNVFGDYALDFLEAGHKTGKPWFMYLAFNAPHFPLHAPEATIEKYEALYRAKGWDAIRAERLARTKKLGLVPQNLELPPRGIVPANRINQQTGWADKEIPAWDTLPPDRQADLARRMAVYAAAVDLMDQNIGRVINHLKKTGEWKNTLVFFLSDNGACAEWDPYGFDAVDSPKNILHKGDDLKQVGGPDSYISYGSGWANACDTPWRLYKHYAEEGGIRTPLIAHWPDGLKAPGSLATGVGYLTDFMPTLLELCGAKYPAERNGVAILPTEGESLVSTLRGGKIAPRVLCVEHEGNRMVRESDWKLVAQSNKPWQLFDLSRDPAETNNLAAREPKRVEKMEAAWNDWAVRCNILSQRSPQIANRALVIRCDVYPVSDDSSGVLLAHGGNQRGYALHLQAGNPIFSVRENGKLTEIAATTATKGRFSIEARLARDGKMTLTVNGKIVAEGKAPGLIQGQPKDDLSVGKDTQSAVGNYTPPHPFKGKVENVRVETL